MFRAGLLLIISVYCSWYVSCWKWWSYV